MNRSLRSPLVLAALAALALPGVLAGQTLFRGEGPSAASPAIGFGATVLVAGDQVLVGRPGIVPGFPMPASEVGAVHIYAPAAGQAGYREVAALRASDGTVGDGFGLSLAHDGDLMAVGAPLAGQQGAVYVFQRTDRGWVQRARLAAPEAAGGDQFGASVALKAGVLVAGAPGRGEGRGVAFAFRRDAAGTWSAGRALAPEGLEANARFGSAVAMEGAMAFISAPGQMGGPALRGGVHLYRRSDAGWTPAGTLVASDTMAYAQGIALALQGDDLFVGAPRTRGVGGAVIHYRRAGSAWTEAGRLVRAAPQGNAAFGLSLAWNGTDLLVGAPLGTGAVHVMRRDGAGAWLDAQKLEVPPVGLGTSFGGAVAATAAMAVIGGPTSDFFEGVGYLYARDAAGTWSQRGTVVNEPSALPAVAGGEVRCADGKVAGFDCQNADLVAFMPTSALGAKRGIMLNDLWGWTDAETGREFAIVGRLDGTTFVEVTDPARPVYLGELPLHEGARPNLWRDIKVYKDHAFIVSDGAGPHGVQIFDLRQLRRVTAAPVTFRETAHYDRIASAHNIVIDTLSGFAYTVGNSSGGETCGGALHMIDIREPAQPKFAGCFADPATGNARTGYTHDSQCTVYHGPDARYTGRQVCFNASETALGIADVTDKAAPKALSSASYPNVGYSHQGWLSDDHKHFFLNDELDELSGNAPKTRTIVWDVTNLEDPVVLTEFLGTTSASDHNLYVKGRYMYQSNYVAGLRIIDIADPAHPVEVGYFDTVPFGENAPGFAGTWSNYPYFKSGVIAVTSMREGLFLIRHRPTPPIP